MLVNVLRLLCINEGEMRRTQKPSLCKLKGKETEAHGSSQYKNEVSHDISFISFIFEQVHRQVSAEPLRCRIILTPFLNQLKLAMLELFSSRNAHVKKELPKLLSANGKEGKIA